MGVIELRDCGFVLLNWPHQSSYFLFTRAYPTFSKPLLITAEARPLPSESSQSSWHSQTNSQSQHRSVGIPLRPRGPWGSALGSPWSSLHQYRHATLLRPSQFHGEPCDFSDKEAEDCVSNAPCRSQVRCEGFVCAQTGIKGTQGWDGKASTLGNGMWWWWHWPFLVPKIRLTCQVR